MNMIKITDGKHLKRYVTRKVLERIKRIILPHPATQAKKIMVLLIRFGIYVFAKCVC